MEEDRPRRSSASQDGERSGESGAGARAKRRQERSVVLSTIAPAIVHSHHQPNTHFNT